MSFAYAAKLRFLQSIGLAFLFVPINTLIYLGVPPGKNNDVSGFSNLARNIGGTAGTTFFTTVLVSYIDILLSLSFICGCMIPLVLLMKRPPKGTQAAVH